MPPIHHDTPSEQPQPRPQPRPPSHPYQNQKLQPDPIRCPPPHAANFSKLSGRGPLRSHRHLHHQRGTIGTFHVRLLEGRGLSRRHWSALSLGPVKHLGLSRAHGEVSSFGRFRLAFWESGRCYCGAAFGERENDVGIDVVVEGKETAQHSYGNLKNAVNHSSFGSIAVTSSSMTDPVQSLSDSNYNDDPSTTTDKDQSDQNTQHTQKFKDSSTSFMPSMEKIPSMIPKQSSTDTFSDMGKSPLTPLFEQGCIRHYSPARSPFFAAFPPNNKQQQGDIHPKQIQSNNSRDLKSQKSRSGDTTPSQATVSKEGIPSNSSTSNANLQSPMDNDLVTIGPPPPHHYAREEFRSSVIHHDSNPIWGNASNSTNSNTHHTDSQHSSEHKSSFHIPLQKDDLYPTLHQDGGHVSLEIRIEEDMTAAESLIVGGALSNAVSAASAMASTIPKVGQHVGQRTRIGAEAGMELLGLGKDRLIGRGFVDLMPLLLGFWEEDFEVGEGNGGNARGEGDDVDGDLEVDEFGRIHPKAYMKRRRVERMGMMDLWVPLYHPNGKTATSGKVHLLISYEPNGMTPKSNDVVAFESFARRSEASSVIAPIVPPLSPLLVIDTRSSYLLLEYTNSRTVTSVDRSGNVKSSRWERSHRIRIHRNAVFVIERPTLMDAAGNLARLPGDIVLSTPLGREVAEISAPLVAAASELIGPAVLWGKLMVAAGGTGVKASLAGAQAATEAVVRASQEKALQSRLSGYVDDRDGGDVGVYRYGV
ncbi:hypothetical protein ACHAXS_012466 [Conticribra weissflogii]